MFPDPHRHLNLLQGFPEIDEENVLQLASVKSQEDWERDNNHQSADEWAEHTGLSVGYYDVVIPANSHTNHEHNQPNDVVISCNDIIEALNMNYACGNVFKAIWRICAAKMGKTKKGNNCKYDAEKAVFFSKRVLEQEGEG